MTSDATIDVHHLTRVEGHGDIRVEIADGRLVEAQFAIVEAPRFFEGFLRDLPYDEVTHVASRICGICAASHKCAALKATEQALGVEVSPQTEMLRRIAFHGEVLSSHLLHIYFLAAPDFLGLPSVMPLVHGDPDLVKRAMRLKALGYDLTAVVAGRHPHPIAMTVGGFSFLIAEDDLLAIRRRLVDAREDLQATIELFAEASIPEFERETEYVSLTHPDRYALYDGDLYSSEGHKMPARRYRDAIEERVVDHSTAKHARWNRPEYMVGALARFNNNFDQLHPAARHAAARLGLEPPASNPFLITVAQLVECVHCAEDAIELIDEVLERGLDPGQQQAEVVPREGTGVGAVEAPRGTLLHEYSYDGDGRCTSANHVIPTAQNLANLEADMRQFVPGILERSKDSIEQLLEMLVRAYDPCISCATHMVRVKR